MRHSVVYRSTYEYIQRRLALFECTHLARILTSSRENCTKLKIV